MLEKELPRKYLAGQCTEEEKLFVNRYLADHTEEIPPRRLAGKFLGRKPPRPCARRRDHEAPAKATEPSCILETGQGGILRSRAFRYLGYAAAAVAAILIPLF